MFRLNHDVKVGCLLGQQVKLSLSGRLLSMNGNFVLFCQITILLILGQTVLSGQDFSEGFQMLDSGKYEQAEVYFEGILKEFSKNKAANICYGRAVGLKGESKKALAFFEDLLLEYPDDVEVNLNLAEAYLWDKKPSEAIKIYQQLQDRGENGYPVIIGMTNSYALSGQYALAIETIQNGIKQFPEQEGSHQLLESLKLAYADSLIKSDKYKQAQHQYLSILDSNSGSIPAYIGMTNISYLLDKTGQCLQYAEKGLTASIDQSTMIEQARGNMVQALIWNHQYDQASESIDEHFNSEGASFHRYSARKAMQQIAYKKSLSHYNSLLNTDSSDSEAWAGRTSALLAMDSIVPAMSAITKGVTQLPNNPNLGLLKSKSFRVLAPSVDMNSKYSWDSGQDESYDVDVFAEVPLSSSLSLLANGAYRELNNNVSASNLSLLRFNGGLKYKFFNHTYANVILGTTRIIDQNVFPSLLSYDFSGETKYKTHQFKIGYRRAFQDYNFVLVDQRLSQRQLYSEYTTSNSKGLGFYGQYVFSQLSDQNKSNLFYGAVFKTIKRIPFIKLGASIQYVAFDESEERTYFSPERFLAQELFIDFVKTADMIKSQGVTYLATIAGGYQAIKDGDSGLSYRLQLRAGYLFKSGFQLEGFALRTNVASSNASGFTFNQLGITAKFYLKQSPLFKVN